MDPLQAPSKRWQQRAARFNNHAAMTKQRRTLCESAVNLSERARERSRQARHRTNEANVLFARAQQSARDIDEEYARVQKMRNERPALLVNMAAGHSYAAHHAELAAQSIDSLERTHTEVQLLETRTTT